MTEFQLRQREIIRQAAVQANRLPVQDSGLWFHGDIRDNFYYAAYLFVATADSSLEQLPFERDRALEKAESILLQVLNLQNRQKDSENYGHFPLNLETLPKQAPPHVLPVELMGSLMAYFYAAYSSFMSEALQQAFADALEHVYQSGFYRKPLVNYGHHEAKYTAAKLIFGDKYGDLELLEDGYTCLKSTLERLHTHGMSDYGCLPWFWHWVQAFTAARELVKDEDIQLVLTDLLNELWRQRADFYLQGAWVGPRARSWPHDAPADQNVLHDYVQFGDFPLPEKMPRTEFAGLLFVEAPSDVRRTALDRSQPTELHKQVFKRVGETDHTLHAYAYITEHFAAGGLWEREQEFDNEQNRWKFSFPVKADGTANQLYFFHPGEGYHAGDPRHESGHAEVLYFKNVVASLFPVPSHLPSFQTNHSIIGVLPKGEWFQEQNALFGRIGETYAAVYVSEPYSVTKRETFEEVTVCGPLPGVVIEVTDAQEAQANGIRHLQQFAEVMRAKAPVFSISPGIKAAEIRYTTGNGDELRLVLEQWEANADAEDYETAALLETASTATACRHSTVFVNGLPLDFSNYSL
jgi:hypothetical protein